MNDRRHAMLRPMIFQEIIRRKRDGHELSSSEVRAFVQGVTNGSVSDEQIAAFTMATWFRGMSHEEQSLLTLAIRDSGVVLQWHDVPGPILDKHSTGGIGDMVSFAVAPIVAECGGFVPMISGRALGHSGGTLDKLESFSGIQVTPDIETFQKWVVDRGLAIIGQTGELAPADQRIYAVRDATATVDSMPLIISSILGKKLAEGLDGLVMDVKVGSGAFMREADNGFQLADDIRKVAESAGLACTALVTDMDQPLSRSAGNALEIREALGYLTGKRRENRFHRVTIAVAAEMLVIGGLAPDPGAAEGMAMAALENGAAAERFAAMVAGQGGPNEPVERLAAELPMARMQREVAVEQEGFVHGIDTREIGLAVVELGGGRHRVSDQVDHSVGIDQLAFAGEEVGPHRPLAVIHGNDKDSMEIAAQMVRKAYHLGADNVGVQRPAVLGRRGPTD